MKNRYRKLIEGEQVVTIAQSYEVPKVVNVTIRGNKYYDRDFNPHLVPSISFGETPFRDNFGGIDGEIPREKVYDYNQLLAHYMNLKRTISLLINNGDINKTAFDKTYSNIDSDRVIRPNGEVKKDDAEDISSVAAECFRLQLTINLLICCNKLEIPKYYSVIDSYTPYTDVPKVKRHK